MTAWKHDHVTLPNLKMHYVREGDGTPLLLLHGWPEFWYTWRKNIPTLAERFDVIAPDFRGSGESENPEAVPDVGDYAEDIVQFIDALDLPKVGLVGHDVGAFVMQDIARRIPDRINGLFFFNCPHPGIGTRWLDGGHYKELWYQAFHQLDWSAKLVGQSRDTCRVYFQHFLNHWAHADGQFDEDLEAWVDNFMTCGNLQGGFNWYRAVANYRQKIIDEGVPSLAPIKIPTYVLWGESDTVLRPEWSDGIEKYFPNITVEIAKDAGHFVHYESPSLANNRILAFFSG